MYFKLAINNVRKSFKDYTVYFLTLTFAVCIFYTFNSISAQHMMETLNDNKWDYINMISKAISMISVFVSVILGLLIIYANNFLIKRRKRELGIYMALGMGKDKISKLLIIEELAIGAFSLIIGIVLGLFSSQGLSIITARIFSISLRNYKFVIAPEAILKTICYFGMIFLLVIIFNTFVISKYNLIDLLNAHKKNENIKVKNPIIAGIIFIISLIMLVTAYYLVNKVGLNVERKEFGISILLGIIGTAAFFYGLTTFLIMVIQKNEKIYLNKLNMFNLRQINSKVNTNFMTMTIICLMLFLTISMISVGVSFKKNNVDSLSPFSATATLLEGGDNNTTFEKILKDNGFKFVDGDKYAFVTEYITNSKLVDILYKNSSEEETKEIDKNITASAISISDYNKMMELSGKEKVKLNRNSVLVQSNSTLMNNIIDKFVEKNNTINLNGKEYKIQNRKTIKVTNITTAVANNIFTLIVPDDLVSTFKPSECYLNINYGENNIEKSEKTYTTFFTNYLENRTKNTPIILFDSKSTIQESTQLISTVVLYITLYLGVIFLISSAAVLALQQLSEASDSIDRYNSLRRIGTPEKMIDKSIFMQTFIYFALPLSLAVIHSIVGIYKANALISAFGSSSIITASIMTMVVIIVIYGGYFIATYFGYKNIVKKL